MMQSAGNFKIGLFGIGLETYWDQFEGLKEQLVENLNIVEERLRGFSGEVYNAGIVDNIDKAFYLGGEFKRQEVDIIFLYAATYALSATVLPVIRKANVPVVVLNLSMNQKIDYTSFNGIKDRALMTKEWLLYCSACPVPEIGNLFIRSGIPFHQVTGILDASDECWKEIEEWVQAARVKHIMEHNRLGCMGHYYSGMMDIYTDMTLQCAIFGGHMEMIEVDELTALRRGVSEEQVQNRVDEFGEMFLVQQDCSGKELRKAARTSLALDLMVKKYKLGSLAYYYKGSGCTENEETISSIIVGNSVLTARGIPVAGEYEIKNAQAMKIMDSFGAGGSFTEYYAMDFEDDVVLMGHDGPGHIAIAEGKIEICPLVVYHGKVGNGLSIQMSVKYGPVTLLSVLETSDGKLKLLVAEGESVAGPILKIGNTNSRYRFAIGARRFVTEWNANGPAHHCAVGVGHISSKIKKLGKLLDMQTVIVC